MKTITFKVVDWDDWCNNIKNNIEGVFAHAGYCDGDVSLHDILFGPPLDCENLQPFCKYYAFDNIYENRVFVRHPKDKHIYWFINSDDTCIIFEPKLA